MSYNDIPAKVIACFVTTQVGYAAWPYGDQPGDPYWQFGASPKDYQWVVTMQITPQRHSSPWTRVPNLYTGMDVAVGDWIASSIDGTAVRIARIDYKSDGAVTCLVEDVYRYNLFRDSSGLGAGLFSIPNQAVLFSLSDAGMPMIDPLPASGVGPTFYPNLMSRFQNQDQATNFAIDLTAHGFGVGDLISADPITHTFQLTDASHVYLIGRVSYVPDPDTFLITPAEPIVDDLDSLPGNVGDILYADDDNPGGLSLTGSTPALIKVRDSSPTTILSSVPNAVSVNGNVLSLNGAEIALGGSGGLADLAQAVNAQTSNTGVIANVVGEPTTGTTDRSLLNTIYGEILFRPHPGTPPTATINGVAVVFSTTTDGQARYGVSCSSVVDIVQDINAAGIPNITAMVANGVSLVLTEQNGNAIVIANGVSDINSVVFAGLNSASGLPVSTPASTQSLVRLQAQDARAINLTNIHGDSISDFGLRSVENGQKAAAIYLEQGVQGHKSLTVRESNAVTTFGMISGTVKSVTIEVTQPWSGQSTLSVGTTGNPALLVSSQDVDLTTPATYIIEQLVDNSAAVSVYVTGSGTGTAIIMIEYLPV